MRDEWAWEGWELKKWKELAGCVQAGSRSPLGSGGSTCKGPARGKH